MHLLRHQIWVLSVVLLRVNDNIRIEPKTRQLILKDPIRLVLVISASKLLPVDSKKGSKPDILAHVDYIHINLQHMNVRATHTSFINSP